MFRNWILPETLPELKLLKRATSLEMRCIPAAERTIWPISSRGASLQAVCRRLLLQPCKRRKPAPFSECSAGRRLLKDKPGTTPFFLIPHLFQRLRKWVDLCSCICLTLLDLWRYGLVSLYTIHPRAFFACIDTSSCDFL